MKTRARFLAACFLLPFMQDFATLMIPTNAGCTGTWSRASSIGRTVHVSLDFNEDLLK